MKKMARQSRPQENFVSQKAERVELVSSTAKKIKKQCY